MKRDWRYIGLAGGIVAICGCATVNSHLPQRAYRIEQTSVRDHGISLAFDKIINIYKEGMLSEITACFSPGRQDKEGLLHMTEQERDGDEITIYVKLGSACTGCHAKGQKVYDEMRMRRI